MQEDDRVTARRHCCVPLLQAMWLLGLGACGGGGGTSEVPAPAPPDPPGLRFVSITPADQATGIPAASGSLSLTVSFAGLTSAGSSFPPLLTCGGASITVSGVTTRNDAAQTLTTTMRYEDLPEQAACQWSTQFSATTPAGVGLLSTFPATFTTDAGAALRYPATVVALLGRKPVIVSLTAPFVTPADFWVSLQRGSFSDCFLGSALLPSGRVPVLCQFSTASGAGLRDLRFNPVSATVTASTLDPLPAGHAYVGDPGPGAGPTGQGWHAAQVCLPDDAFVRNGCVSWLGGAAAPPIAGARAWAGDAAGGMFFVEAASPNVLRYRDAAGAPRVVYSADVSADPPGQPTRFTLLQSFSN